MARRTAAGLPNPSGTAAAVAEVENADRSSSTNFIRLPPPATAAVPSSADAVADAAAAAAASAADANTDNDSSSGSSSSGRSRSSCNGGQIRLTHTPLSGPLVADTKRQTCDGSTRRRLSKLLSRHTVVAAGKYACGAKLEPQQREWFPRIKLKAMPASLSLPLTSREATRLKESQINAGQERDVNMDGAPETRLPWAVRPGADFKIVNNRIWTSMVVAPVLKQVGGVVCVCDLPALV